MLDARVDVAVELAIVLTAGLMLYDHEHHGVGTMTVGTFAALYKVKRAKAQELQIEGYSTSLPASMAPGRCATPDLCLRRAAEH